MKAKVKGVQEEVQRRKNNEIDMRTAHHTDTHI